MSQGEFRRLLPNDAGHRGTLKVEVKTGDIAKEILPAAVANRADRIVLGARHGAPLADRLPRTKLSTIIREARCPVLVVPANPS